MKSPSKLELEFDQLWNENFPDIDLYAEQIIIPGRRFKFDYVNYPAKVAIEINGQIWHKGGHSSGKGLMRDYEKGNLAAKEGYLTFQLSAKMITLEWLQVIADSIQSRLEVRH